jgi:predicted AlkP superfamily pyrophosphatase or phosphodiesterase
MSIIATASTPVIDANAVVGQAGILLITLDSLRYDVARAAHASGDTPCLASRLPASGWQARHAPGTFTYPAHHAIFAGFLPKPARPGTPESRLFECRPPEGKHVRPTTYVIDGDNLITGLAEAGYHTVCIGGVDYFAGQTPLGQVFPRMFAESHWATSFSSAEPESTRHQIDQALTVLKDNADRRLMMFLNISATHVPHHHYLPEPDATDGWRSQYAALAYADGQIGRLLDALPEAGSWLVVICADHGDAFGDDGYEGHVNAHPSVMTVPYTQFLAG